MGFLMPAARSLSLSLSSLSFFHCIPSGFPFFRQRLRFEVIIVALSAVMVIAAGGRTLQRLPHDLNLNFQSCKLNIKPDSSGLESGCNFLEHTSTSSKTGGGGGGSSSSRLGRVRVRAIFAFHPQKTTSFTSPTPPDLIPGRGYGLFNVRHYCRRN